MKKVAWQINSNLPGHLPVQQRAALLIVSTYTDPKLTLGPGPINDSISLGALLRSRGFRVYFAHNPSAQDVRLVVAEFLRKTWEFVWIGVTGHGSRVRDTSGDEDDGYDEALVFDKGGYIVDDEWPELLAANCDGRKRVVLWADCCHASSIFDLQSADRQGVKLPANICNLGASGDAETAKQVAIDKLDQGLFTHYAVEAMTKDPQITPRRLIESVRKAIQRFKQAPTVAVTSPGLEDVPLLPVP